MLHLISLKEWTAERIGEVLDLAAQVKAHPDQYARHLEGQTLIMMFEKPSLRTRVSFEVGMHQLGGFAIFYDLTQSPLGKGKESVHDTVKTLSRYGDLIMARLFEHEKLQEMAEHTSIPVINGLTDYAHPCQVLADLLTIREHKGRLRGLTVAYLGDSNNNVTHSLMFGCAMLGLNIRVGCPAEAEFVPAADVVAEARVLGDRVGSRVLVTHDPVEAVRDADVVYTDSWISYHIAKDQLERRTRTLLPFQVNGDLMAAAAKDAVFMNCLPAMRGYEQTAEVIDGPQSVVFDQAENRLHAQKAVMMMLASSRAMGL